MNPMTNVKNIKKLSEQELKQGNLKSSWHDQYKDSAWLFVGGLPYDLTEGDIICVFSQYGEVVNINLIRDKGTGKSKGYCFLCYEDQRSTVLAVDNFNSIKLLGRTIRVDHVADYRPPKESDKLDDETRRLYSQGCALTSEAPVEHSPAKAPKKEKKEKTKQKKRKKKKKKKAKTASGSSSSDDSSSSGSESEGDGETKSKRKKADARTKRQRLEQKIRALEMALKAARARAD